MTQHQHHLTAEDLAFGGMKAVGSDVRPLIELLLERRLAELRLVVQHYDDLTDRRELALAEKGLSIGPAFWHADCRLALLTEALLLLQPYVDEFEGLVDIELRPETRERPEYAEPAR